MQKTRCLLNQDGVRVASSTLVSMLAHPALYSALQVMATIGEQFTEGDEICGVAVNIRQKGDRIEMWTKTSSNEAAQVRDYGVG